MKPIQVIMSTEAILNDPDFMQWAFGQNVGHMIPPDIFPLWNKLHGDKLTIYSDGVMGEDQKKMVQLYLDEVNNEQSISKTE